MRTMASSAAALVLCVAGGATAWSAPITASDRQLKAAVADTEKGRDQLDRLLDANSNSSRLYRLDRALMFLRRSRVSTAKSPTTEGVARVRAETDRLMVRALTRAAEIDYSRRSLSRAEKRIDEARTIDPMDARVRVLHDMILEAKTHDVYTDFAGTVALQRIIDRRATFGAPLRDRGTGRLR